MSKRKQHQLFTSPTLELFSTNTPKPVPPLDRVPPDTKDRFVGAVLGAAVGDALGHPTEFLSMEAIRDRYGLVGVQGFELWRDAPDGGRFAPYTDDTQMAEVVLRSLSQTRREIDVDALVREGMPAKRAFEHVMAPIAKGFVAWADNPQGGHRAPGNACLAGCRELAAGAHWSRSGGEAAGGCGSVMRAFPFGLLYADNLEAAVTLAVEHSKMTHRDPIALAACAAMAAGVVEVMNAAPTDRVVLTMEVMAARYCPQTAAMISGAVEDAYAGVSPLEVLDRLRGWAAHEAIAAAVYVFVRHADDPRAALLEAANTPGDSDCIATLVGALDGARWGIGALPADWVRDVERSVALQLLAVDALYRMPKSALDSLMAPSSPGTLTLDSSVNAWELWDTCIDLAVDDFREAHGVWPNALYASSASFERISLEAARSSKVVDDDGDAPPPGDVVDLEMFFGARYALDFVVDDSLDIEDIRLVYDSHPLWKFAQGG